MFFNTSLHPGYGGAVHVPNSLRVGATALLIAATVSSVTSPAPAAAAPANIAGMIVFLDPGHNGANDASISRQVPTGRGGTKDCQASGTSSNSGYPEHTFNWDTTCGYGQHSPNSACAPRCRAATTTRCPCVDERAAMANAIRPNAIVSIHADGGPANGRGFHVLYSSPPLNTAQAGPPAIQFAQVMRDQIQGSGIPPANYIGSGGLDARSDIAGLNLAQYPPRSSSSAAT